jgi:hypothetical protein
VVLAEELTAGSALGAGLVLAGLLVLAVRLPAPRTARPPELPAVAMAERAGG